MAKLLSEVGEKIVLMDELKEIKEAVDKNIETAIEIIKKKQIARKIF